MNAIRKLIIATACCFTLSVPAYSHTELSASSPADEAALEHAPEVFSLTFSAAVRLTAFVLEHDSESHSIEVDSTEPATEFTVGLPALEPGEYVVQWRALSEDTHVVTGEIRFTIES